MERYRQDNRIKPNKEKDLTEEQKDQLFISLYSETIRPDNRGSKIKEKCLTHLKLVAYLSGGLSGTRKKNVESHLQKCGKCFGLLLKMQKVRTEDFSLDIPPSITETENKS